MTPQEARELFSQLLKDRAENRRKVDEKIKDINTRLLDHFNAAATRKLEATGKRRGKKDYTKILTPDEISEVKNRYTNEYQSTVDAASRELREIDERLGELADQAEIIPGSPTSIRRFNKYTYSTQTAAARYAEGVAKAFAECYRRFSGVEAEAVHTDEPDEWNVYVNVATELDLEILRRRGEGPLKEIVRILLKNGLNPKVVNSAFPYPEEIGLDWWGNDKPGAKA